MLIHQLNNVIYTNKIRGFNQKFKILEDFVNYVFPLCINVFEAQII